MKLYHQAHRRYFAGAVISVLIATILGVTLQFFKGLVLDYAIAGNIPATLRFAGLLFSFIIAEIGFYYAYDHFSIRYVAGSSHNLRNDLFQSILKRDYIRYQQLKLGEYLAKFTNDASAIESRRFELLPLLWQILFKILAVSIGLFILDWRVALVTLGLLTTPLYLPKLIEKQLQQAQTNYLNSLESSLSEITDWLKGFELIKNYTIEQELMKQYRPINHHVAKRQLINRRVEILAQLITTLISYLSYFVILAVSTWLVLTRQFSAGDFFIAIGMIDQLSYPLISLSGIIRQLISIRPTTEAMQTFIDQSETTRAKHSLKRWDNQIIFQSVNFSYEDRLILNDLDLRFTKGKRYLIKGPSGSGKTTIINLLLRYFEPDDGQILVDQTPLEQYDDVYPVMTIVRQDATFFVASLRDNLTMFQEVAEDRIKEILQAVGLGRYADSSLLDEIVQEGGSNFSGGERKRLSLARALLRDTEVLLIDEPLANLDDFTARLIEDLLLSIKHKTMIIVSHQFSPEKLNQLDQVIELT